MSSKYLKIKYENKCKMISTPKSFFEFVEIVKNNLDLSNNKHYQFSYLDDENDSYGTFVVYIVRQNETINSIIEKYNTNLEELEKYNDLKEINIGTKLIIPLLND